MNNLIYSLSWNSQRKYVFSTSLAAFFLWISAYAALHNTHTVLCTEATRPCIDFWLHTFGSPLWFGHLLKATIVAPLLLLFSSRLAFRVWVAMSIIVLPYALFVILVQAPIYGQYFNKLSMSNASGIAYLSLSAAIAVGVPLIEYVVRRLRA